jgi:site-specific DNA recombinase
LIRRGFRKWRPKCSGITLSELSSPSDRAVSAPQEIQELIARIDRLRARLRAGDPDMAPDEIQAAIEKVEAKRRDLEANLPEAKQSVRILSILPKAAEMYRDQINKGWVMIRAQQ